MTERNVVLYQVAGGFYFITHHARPPPFLEIDNRNIVMCGALVGRSRFESFVCESQFELVVRVDLCT